MQDLSALTAIAAAAPPTIAWSIHAMVMRHRLTTARRDPLTNLPTRAAFTTRARHMIPNPKAVALVIDLDGFKTLNDDHGHAAGDAALIAVADRLTTWTGPRGTTARLGGDEFAAVITATANLRHDLRQLHTRLCQPIPYADGQIHIGVSIGAMPAAHLPVPGLSAALRRADEAMYNAKRTGGGYLIASGTMPVHDTVNGRRTGRDGTTHPQTAAPR